MGSDDYLHSIFRRDEITEGLQAGAGGITDHQTCGQMDDLRAVFFHLLGGILHVSPGASAAGGITHQLDFFSLIPGKGPLAPVKRA